MNDKTAEIYGVSKNEAFDKSLVSTFIAQKFRKSVQDNGQYAQREWDIE